MKLNKTMMAVATAAMAFGPVAGSMPVFAAEGTTNPTTETTDVKYLVEDGYQWTIHSAIDFDKNKGVNSHSDVTDQKVTVTKNVIQEGKKLNIKVAGSGADKAFTITNGKSEVLPYHIKNGASEISVNGDVLNVNAGTNTGEVSLDYTLDTTTKAAEVAGQYSGTVTYTASIVDQK